MCASYPIWEKVFGASWYISISTLLSPWCATLPIFAFWRPLSISCSFLITTTRGHMVQCPAITPLFSFFNERYPRLYVGQSKGTSSRARGETCALECISFTFFSTLSVFCLHVQRVWVSSTFVCPPERSWDLHFLELPRGTLLGDGSSDSKADVLFLESRGTIKF